MIGCFGSQFMAKALGAAVRSGQALEIGMTLVHLTDAETGSVFGNDRDFTAFEWHGKSLTCRRLCRWLFGHCASAGVPLWRSCYGLLFHLEMEEDGIDAPVTNALGLDEGCLTAHHVKSTALPQLRSSIKRLTDRLSINPVVDYRLIPEVVFHLSACLTGCAPSSQATES